MQHPFHPSRIQHTSCNFLGEKTMLWQSATKGWKWVQWMSWSSTWCSCLCRETMSDKWTKLHVTKLWVKDGVWQNCVWVMAREKVVCVPDCVCVCQMVCGSWHVMRVWQTCVWWMVCDQGCVSAEAVCVWEMPCCEEDVWQTFHVAKMWKMVWDRDGVWQSCGRKILFVCQRRCVAKLGMTTCMWQRCVRKRVCVWQRYDRSSGATKWRKLCVKICCGTDKFVTKLREKKRWDKDGVWLRWRLTKII